MIKPADQPAESKSTSSHYFYQNRTRKPQLSHALGVYLWDKTGKQYLDGSSGPMVCNIGHSNPRVLAAMREQMDRSTYGSRQNFTSDAAETLASETAALMPASLNQVFFVSGGSEAVESAIKMARQYALASGQVQRYKIISRFPSYHGCTLGALAATGYAPMSAPFAPMLPGSYHIPSPTCYLDNDALSDAERGLGYANMLEAEILRQGPETVLAFVVEPIGGASTGALVPPQGYMERIREICDQYNVLLVYDEVMTGGGRTGRYLAAEHWQTDPDIVILSKGYGAGYMPLGGIVVRNDIVDTVLSQHEFVHGFTYGGNPLACAAGVAVLKELQQYKLIENAELMGRLLKQELQNLMNDYAFIGDVRGKGLLLAFELVSDRNTMAPLPTGLNAYTSLVDLAFDEGLLIYSRRSRGGLCGDHFLVCPPLIVNREHIDEIMTKLNKALQRFSSAAGLDA